MRVPFRVQAALAVVAFLVLVGAGFAWLMGNVGCAALSAERVPDPAARGASSPTPMPEGDPLALDEARTRAEAPALAGLLDAALREGARRSTTRGRRARRKPT